MKTSAIMDCERQHTRSSAKFPRKINGRRLIRVGCRQGREERKLMDRACVRGRAGGNRILWINQIFNVKSATIIGAITPDSRRS